MNGITNVLLLRVRPAFSLLVILLLMTGVTAVATEQISVEYMFDRPQLETVILGGTTYDRVTMTNAPNSGDVGHPSLPSTGAQILVPYGTEITDIQIIRGEEVLVAEGVLIEPTAQPVKLSADPGEYVDPSEDPIIYAMSTPYPGYGFESIGVSGFRGYQILTLKLQPVQYVPASGELYYYPKMTVIMNTANTGMISDMWRGFESDELEVKSRIDNPEASQSYPMTAEKSRGAFDMVIITTSSLAPAFGPLKDYHDSTGLATEIHTTTDIGSSSPDDIRAYIRALYLNDGIDYVIIGADDDIIPAKDLWVEAWSGGDIETAMPSDVYFGCLDGTYNYDGDGYSGEPNDGDGGGDVDLVAEVYVGRAAAGNTTEVTRFVDKTIWYLSNQHGHAEKVLMVGEYLGFGGVSDYAASMMDQNVDGSSADGYTTIGIPSDTYEIDRLYDETWAGNDWPQFEIVNRINSGLHIVNHLGHGSPDYAMKMYNSNITGDLTNTDLCFLYSQTCLAGHFDGTDCFAETMNIKTDNGAFGVCMNARYGWGSGYSTDGPSQRFNREFWDAVFNPLESKPEIGRASQDSKEDNLYRINESCMRWIYYEQNLFGDPSVAIKGVAGIAFEYPTPLPNTVQPNETITVEVTVIPIGSGVSIAGSGRLHYSLNGEAYVEIPMTELFSNQYEVALPVLSCDDNLRYYFSAEEQTTGIHYDVDPSTPHTLSAATSISIVFEDNFENDNGWTVSGSATDGQWDRGVPVGGGDRGDPPTDFDGSGACYLTDNVDDNSDVDGGTTTLMSPVIDLSTGDAEIHYARWYSNNNGGSPNADTMKVYISNNNGGNWTLVEQIGPTEQSGGGWYEHSFMVSEFVTPTSLVKMRFDASDNGDGSVIEAGIDDFTVTITECEAGSQPNIDSDNLPDWTSGVAFSEQLAASGGTGSLIWSDKNGDLVGTGLSLTTGGLVVGTPTGSGTINFIALVTDEALQTDEQPFSFVINPAITINTTSLPEWTEDIAYSQQLVASGGTGTLGWTDELGELVGTGLALSTSGLVSGAPSSTGTIEFTARVDDAVGGTQLQLLSININVTVAIVTDSLSEGVEGETYSQQLEATGGTGVITFVDFGNDLDGTGLTLSPDGILSGTVPTAQIVTFTARASDQVGSTIDKPFSVEFVVSYICGDANGDGSEILDIQDLVYIVDYMFNSGPAPSEMRAVDVDGSGYGPDIADLVYLVTYMFQSGPELNCP